MYHSLILNPSRGPNSKRDVVEGGRTVSHRITRASRTAALLHPPIMDAAESGEDVPDDTDISTSVCKVVLRKRWGWEIAGKGSKERFWGRVLDG